MLLMLIDPSIIKGCAPPENNEDLVLSVQQRWVYFVDNLTEIKAWLSDSLCRLLTGSADRGAEQNTKTGTRRSSCATSCLVHLNLRRDPHPDLVSRTIKFDLPSVHATRKPEAELWDEFYAARPKILGRALTPRLRQLYATGPQRKKPTYRGLLIGPSGSRPRNPGPDCRRAASWQPTMTRAKRRSKSFSRPM